MASVLIEFGARRGLELALEPGVNVLGRSPDCQLQFEDSTVSGRHCEIHVTPFGVRVRDLGSSNGIAVDGQPVHEAELRDGQRLALGELVLRVTVPPTAIAIPALSEPEPTGPAFLPDGTPACVHHRTEPAAFRCVHCRRTLCDACVHRLRLVGGRPRLLCPDCSHACQHLDDRGAGDESDTWSARLWQSVRTAFDFRSRRSRQSRPPRHRRPPSGGTA